MIKTSTAFKDALTSRSRHIDAYFLYGQKTYQPLSFTLEKKVYSSDKETFIGTFIGKSGKIKIQSSDEINLENQWIQIFEGIQINESYQYVSMGTYQVYEKTAAQEYSFADRRILFNVKAEVDEILYPTTPLKLAQWVCRKVGVELANVAFPNCDLEIPSAVYYGSEATYADIITAIAQASCSFAVITNDDKLMFKWFEEVDFQLNIENISKNWPVCSETFGPVNSLVLSREPMNDNVFIQDDQSVAQNGLTEIKIANNPILDIDRHTSKLAIFNLINGFEYIPIKVDTQGMFILEAGDIIPVQQKDGSYVNMYVMDHTITYRGSCSSSFDTPALTKTQIDYQKAESMRQLFKNTEAIVDKQNQKIELVIENQDEQNNKISKFEQDINGISSTVSETTAKVEVIEAAKRYHIELTSSNGTAFRNGDINTNLSVKIYSWDDDISAVVSDGAVKWSRMSTDVAADEKWNRTGKNINITSADLTDYAVFIARWNTIEARMSLVNVNDGAQGKDAILIMADSSNGMSFKNSQIATILTISVIMGDRLIDSHAKLVDVFGDQAKICWQVKNMHDTEFADIDENDPRIDDHGFIFKVNAKDVKTKAVFNYYLDY